MRNIKEENRIINNIISMLNEKVEQGYTDVICGIRDYKKTGNYGYLPYDIIKEWSEYRFDIEEEYQYENNRGKILNSIDNKFHKKISENC